jgi:hypothetical protein
MRNIIVNRRSGKQVFYGLDGHVSADAAKAMEVQADGYSIRVTGPGL